MRSNLFFRAAVEDFDVVNGTTTQSDDRVIMKGPLADAYTDALNIVYAKTRPGNTGGGEIANESAANDELMMRELAEAVLDTVDAKAEEHPATLYGVSANAVSESDIVNINKELYEQPEGQVVLVMDATGPGPNSPEDSLPEERVMYVRHALEAMVTAHGGRVYPSLEAYAKARVGQE
jgi:hypothetical protein